MEYRRGHVRILDRRGLEGRDLRVLSLSAPQASVCRSCPVELSRDGEQQFDAVKHRSWLIAEYGDLLGGVGHAANPDARDPGTRPCLLGQGETVFVLRCRERMAQHNQIESFVAVAVKLFDAGDGDRAGELAQKKATRLKKTPIFSDTKYCWRSS